MREVLEMGSRWRNTWSSGVADILWIFTPSGLGLATGMSSATALGAAAEDDPIDADAEGPVKNDWGGQPCLFDCGWAMAGFSPHTRDIILAWKSTCSLARDMLAFRIGLGRELVRVEAQRVQGSLQMSALLAQFQQGLIWRHVQPFHAGVPPLLQKRVAIEGDAGNSCMLDVEFECILWARFGIARMPCVDKQESLDGQRCAPEFFRHLLVDVCARLETLDIALSWCTLADEVT